MTARAEFLIEPFIEGTIGPHVQAAIDSLQLAGFDVEVGPFANIIVGDPSEVAEAVAGAIRAAIETGARRVSVDYRVEA